MDQEDDDVMEISEADELIIDLKEIPQIKKYEQHIKDAFAVQVGYGLVSDDAEEHQKKQWISLEGGPGNRAVAKDYIKALCNPDESFSFSYPEDMHDYLTKIKVHGKLERQSRTAIIFQEIGELKIQGTNLHVTLGLSAVEDLVGHYHQEQADLSGLDLSLLGESSPPVQRQSSARLSSELHRLATNSQRVIEYEDDDLDSMPDHIKRTMISVYRDIEEDTSEHTAGSTVSDGTPVKVLGSKGPTLEPFVNIHRIAPPAVDKSRPATIVRNPILHEGQAAVASNLGNLQLASSASSGVAFSSQDSPMSSGDESDLPVPSLSGLPLLSQYTSQSVLDSSKRQPAAASSSPPRTYSPPPHSRADKPPTASTSEADEGPSSFYLSEGELAIGAEFMYTQVIQSEEHLQQYAQNHGYSDMEIKKVFDEKGNSLTTLQFIQALDVNREQMTPARRKGGVKAKSAISGHKSIVEASGQDDAASEKLEAYLKVLERDCAQEEEETLSREDLMKKNAERQKILGQLYKNQQDQKQNVPTSTSNTPAGSKSKRKRKKKKVPTATLR